jgi:ribosomal subunit interface protein
MVQKLEIAGEHYEIDENLRKYVTRKIGRLDKYLSKHSRESAHIEVRMKEQRSNGQKQLNMYAAIDIVQAKLKHQMQRYKELHSNGKLRRHLFTRGGGDVVA